MEKGLLILESTFHELEATIEKMNENAVRDMTLDLNVMSEGELKKTLESKKGFSVKRRILLTQTGYLRINTFNECYKRVQLFEENQEFDEAVKIMKFYIEKVATQFLQERLHPSLINRMIDLFSSSRLPNAAKTLEEWRLSLSSWSEGDKSLSLDGAKKIKDFAKIKELFVTLDMLSFTFDNFPPLATDPAH